MWAYFHLCRGPQGYRKVFLILQKVVQASGDPLVVYNVWDGGGARAVTAAGADAIATGSWSVAAAHGYEDGETVPLDFVTVILARVVAATDLPVSVNFALISLSNQVRLPPTCSEILGSLQLLGGKRDTGTIEAGMTADIIVVDGNPLHNI